VEQNKEVKQIESGSLGTRMEEERTGERRDGTGVGEGIGEQHVIQQKRGKNSKHEIKESFRRLKVFYGGDQRKVGEKVRFLRFHEEENEIGGG